jgi:hypothetical protein
MAGLGKQAKTLTDKQVALALATVAAVLPIRQVAFARLSCHFVRKL